jgi:hypothetical protein
VKITKVEDGDKRDQEGPDAGWPKDMSGEGVVTYVRHDVEGLSQPIFCRYELTDPRDVLAYQLAPSFSNDPHYFVSVAQLILMRSLPEVYARFDTALPKVIILWWQRFDAELKFEGRFGIPLCLNLDDALALGDEIVRYGIGHECVLRSLEQLSARTRGSPAASGKPTRVAAAAG